MSEPEHSQHPQLERLRQSRSERAEKREQQREHSKEKERGVIASGASLTTRAALASVRGHSLTKIARKSFGFGR